MLVRVRQLSMIHCFKMNLWSASRSIRATTTSLNQRNEFYKRIQKREILKFKLKIWTKTTDRKRTRRTRGDSSVNTMLSNPDPVQTTYLKWEWLDIESYKVNFNSFHFLTTDIKPSSSSIPFLGFFIIFYSSSIVPREPISFLWHTISQLLNWLGVFWMKDIASLALARL